MYYPGDSHGRFCEKKQVVSCRTDIVVELTCPAKEVIILKQLSPKREISEIFCHHKWLPQIKDNIL